VYRTTRKMATTINPYARITNKNTVSKIMKCHRLMLIDGKIMNMILTQKLYSIKEIDNILFGVGLHRFHLIDDKFAYYSLNILNLSAYTNNRYHKPDEEIFLEGDALSKFLGDNLVVCIGMEGNYKVIHFDYFIAYQK